MTVARRVKYIVRVKYFDNILERTDNQPTLINERTMLKAENFTKLTAKDQQI